VPLRAFVDGKEVSAPLLNEAQWEALKNTSANGAEIILTCCGGHGYLRRSQQGLKHFVHKRGESKCDWKPETWQHLKAKTDIIVACADAGYQAQAEVAAMEWRADVLATHGKVRVAFEVQWSPQNLSETIERQRRYERDHVRGCWFFRKPPRNLTRDLAIAGPELDARQDLPLFPLLVDDDGTTSIDLYSRNVPLNEFVAALLKRQVRFCKDAATRPEQHVRVIFFEMKCAGCGEYSHLYFVTTALQSCCGLTFRPSGDLYSDDFTFRPEIVSTVQRHLQMKKGKHLHMGDIKPRTSQLGHGEFTMSFGCHDCDAIFDPFAVRMELSYWRRVWEDDATDKLDTVICLDTPIVQPLDHWCYAPDGAFCCER